MVRTILLAPIAAGIARRQQHPRLGQRRRADRPGGVQPARRQRRGHPAGPGGRWCQVGVAAASFPAPPVGSGYRIRVEDAADPAIDRDSPAASASAPDLAHAAGRDRRRLPPKPGDPLKRYAARRRPLSSIRIAPPAGPPAGAARPAGPETDARRQDQRASRRHQPARCGHRAAGAGQRRHPRNPPRHRRAAARRRARRPWRACARLRRGGRRRHRRRARHPGGDQRPEGQGRRHAELRPAGLPHRLRHRAGGRHHPAAGRRLHRGRRRPARAPGCGSTATGFTPFTFTGV